MNNLWAGRFKKELDAKVNTFNASIKIDKALYKEDILGSIAHAKMLAKENIIPKEDADKIVSTLSEILDEIESGKLSIDESFEDIHTFLEAELTKRAGDAGKKLHTARSRNDQVATDTRLFALCASESIIQKLCALIKTLAEIAQDHKNTIICGLTHLQKAQPVTLAQHLLAYAYMFMRDADRILDCKKRTSQCPLGSCALAGTTYPIDREFVAKELGFSGVVSNSMDGVSDRDFVLELMFDISLIMTHLSRLSEEIVLWCSWEYRYIELDDAYSTGSSIMPQKKNPDIAELIRAKTGRANGNLVALLTVLKALPLAYNKDLQEDKEALFDSVDTVENCLEIFADMLRTMTVNPQNMLLGADQGFVNATDCADYLTKKGVPFRDAYKTTGRIVAYCIDNNKTLNTMTLGEYKKFDELFERDIYDAVDLKNCVEKRVSQGGPSAASVEIQLKEIEEFLKKIG
jgi:argininosuccinate lyase